MRVLDDTADDLIKTYDWRETIVIYVRPRWNAEKETELQNGSHPYNTAEYIAAGKG